MSNLIIRVLQEYDIRQPDSVIPFHEGQGFSGSDIWKVTYNSRFYCLKRWPDGKPSDQTRTLIQSVIPEVEQQGLPVAAPVETRDGRRFVRIEKRWWDLSPWLPGTPGNASTLTEAQLQQAMQWLARYHRLAAGIVSDVGQSPAISYRHHFSRQLFDGSLNLLTERKYLGLDPGIADLFVSQANRRLPWLINVLASFADSELDLLPALSDVWSDHIFFQGEEISGVIDFGAIKLDSACLDIARLLGSYATVDTSVFTRGIKYYRTERSLEQQDVALVELFDQAHVVLAGLQWLVWLGPEQRVFKQMEKVNQHLKSLAQRIDC